MGIGGKTTMKVPGLEMSTAKRDTRDDAGMGREGEE